MPSRNHLAALLLARDLSARTKERVTVFNGDGRTGAKLLAALEFPAGRLRVIDRRLAYPDYLREVSRHKIVLQLDSSFVPGQVAGDALLCRMPCVGGNGAIDRIAFSDTCGFARSIADLKDIAERLLQDRAQYAAERREFTTSSNRKIVLRDNREAARRFFHARSFIASK